MNKYELLCKRIQRLKSQPQSGAREEALLMLEWEREEMMAKRCIKVLHRARMLVEAYQKNGSMTVIYPSGQQLTDRPYHTDSPVQNVWNLRGKALAMASASIPYE